MNLGIIVGITLVTNIVRALRNYSDTHIYEVKWTAQLKKNYGSFLLQLFCYGAMEWQHIYI